MQAVTTRKSKVEKGRCSSQNPKRVWRELSDTNGSLQWVDSANPAHPGKKGAGP